VKVCAINASPRGEKGNTFRILSEIKHGMAENGAEVNIINLKDKNIEMCIGCLRCWDKAEDTEIRCVLKDDVRDILLQMLGSDMIILGTPLYYESINGLMKVFLERLVMLHNADIIEREGIYTHDTAFKVPPIAAVCSCDLPGQHNFELVSKYMKKIAFNLKTVLIAEIYQCEARLLKWPGESIKIITNVQKEVWIQAGRELSATGALSERTVSKLRTPMIKYIYYIETVKELAKEIKEKARKNISDGYGGY